jgi:type IV pilus assembly protein PilX
MKTRLLKPTPLPPSHSQRGVALAVSLILLIIVTLLALSNFQTVTLEEKMTAATYDRQLAFQAAEAALREGEQYVTNNKPTPQYTDADDNCPGTAINNCADGVCPVPDKDCPPRWLTSSGFTQWKNATATVNELTPQYFIEFMKNNADCTDGGVSDPKNCKLYRITGRAGIVNGRSTVVLQSLYKTE